MVVALGILHTMQKAGAPLPSPAKDIVVAIGLLLFAAAIVYARSARSEDDRDEMATTDGAPAAPEVVALNADDVKTRPPVSLDEYDPAA
jgi:hypothetical protein